MNPISLPPKPGASGFAGADPPDDAAAVVVAPAAVVVFGVSLASLFEPHAASASAPATSKGMTRLVFTLLPFWVVLGGLGPRQTIDCSKTRLRPSGSSSRRCRLSRISTRR